jgi:phosphoglycerol transferase MdoB-like AlkP superfamily enzyme
MKTLFFVTHNRDFDNVNGFVTMQGFERLFAEEDYDIKTDKTWGIDDHLLFDRALKEIDAEISNGNNVAAIVLTCSNHRPFNHPDVEGMVYTATDDEEMAIEYADWSMNRFIDMAREKEWFDDTLFVITADHGRSMQEDFVMTESVFHIPLLFYSPKHIAPEIRSDLVAQVDITPTMASMLGVSYDNHTMGIDLNSQSRDYAVITTPTHIGCRSKEWLYAYDINTKVEYLYDLTAEGDACLKNVASEHADIVATMHLHATATIQAGWDMHNTPEQKKSDK